MRNRPPRPQRGEINQRRRQPEPTIIHADDSIVVVDKPAGVLSVPAKGSAPVLLDCLRELNLIDDVDNVRPVHRLDRDVSGVIVFARTLDAMQRLTDQFAGRSVEKVYLALVNGYVKADGEVNLPLLADRARRRVTVDRKAGKRAITRYRVLERLKGLSLLECTPATGRLHQIRVHLSAIGHPLAVDPLYGGGHSILLSEFKADYRPNRQRGERPLIDRLTLHALRLKFDHPHTGKPVVYEAPLPKDFRATLNQLRRV